MKITIYIQSILQMFFKRLLSIIFKKKKTNNFERKFKKYVHIMTCILPIIIPKYYR